MSRSIAPSLRRDRSGGFSLIVVSLLLVVVTVLGVGAARLSLVNERSARSDRDQEIALQAAEAALVDAELDILGPNANPASRLCLFNNKDVAPFAWQQDLGRLRHLHRPDLCRRQGDSASAGQATHIFRVTAIGFGVDTDTQVVLQTNLYKPAVSAGCP